MVAVSPNIGRLFFPANTAGDSQLLHKSFSANDMASHVCLPCLMMDTHLIGFVGQEGISEERVGRC